MHYANGVSGGRNPVKRQCLYAKVSIRNKVSGSPDSQTHLKRRCGNGTRRYRELRIYGRVARVAFGYGTRGRRRNGQPDIVIIQNRNRYRLCLAHYYVVHSIRKTVRRTKLEGYGTVILIDIVILYEHRVGRSRRPVANRREAQSRISEGHLSGRKEIARLSDSQRHPKGCLRHGVRRYGEHHIVTLRYRSRSRKGYHGPFIVQYCNLRFLHTGNRVVLTVAVRLEKPHCHRAVILINVVINRCNRVGRSRRPATAGSEGQSLRIAPDFSRRNKIAARPVNQKLHRKGFRWRGARRYGEYRIVTLRYGSRSRKGQLRRCFIIIGNGKGRCRGKAQ